MKQFYALFIGIFVIAHKLFAQYPIFAPNQNGSLLYINPGVVGNAEKKHLGSTYLLQTWKKKTIYQTYTAEWDGYVEELGGGVGVTLMEDRLNDRTHTSSAGLIYALDLAISRDLNIRPVIKLDFTKTKINFSDLLNRYYLPEDNSLPLPYSSSHSSVNAGAGVLASTSSIYGGVFFRNLNNPNEAKIGISEIKNPIHFSSFLGSSVAGLGGRLMPILTYESQNAKYPVDSLSTNLINPTRYFSINLNYDNKRILAGLGYRNFMGRSSSYHLQVGLSASRRTKWCYNIGMAPFHLDDGSNTQVFYHQITVEHTFRGHSSFARSKFRSASCPAFGWGGSYSYSSSYGYGGGKNFRSRTTAGSFGSNSDGLNYSSIMNDSAFKPGTLTAGEINDFSKWNLWNDVSKKELAQYQGTWKITPLQRYAVHVINQDKKPVINCTAKLCEENGTIIWEGKTDNMGKAELWTELFDKNAPPAYIEIKSGDQQIRVDSVKPFEKGVNTITFPAPCTDPNQVDILFMVDATGSMSDEINYLKAELKDIISECKTQHPETSLSLGSLFYRCKGNSYVTKKSYFSEDINKTIDFIKDQIADEGGDESVEVALHEAVDDFAWRETAAARIIFMVLDEAPGTKDSILKTLHNAIRAASAKGIRIIPLVASGTGYADKSLEYLMRSIALATNGTYAFLTDHSGVGNKHTAPSADEYDVEYMNKLLLRLISQCMSTHCSEKPSDYISGMKDTTLVEVIEHVILDTTAYTKHLQELENAENSQNTETSGDSLPAKDTLEIVAKPGHEITGDTLIKKSFRFYPNPSKGKVFIECQGGIKTLYLADMNGKILTRFPIAGDGITEIDIGDQLDGLYNLVYENGKKIFSGKIVLLK